MRGGKSTVDFVGIREPKLRYTVRNDQSSSQLFDRRFVPQSLPIRHPCKCHSSWRHTLGYDSRIHGHIRQQSFISSGKRPHIFTGGNRRVGLFPFKRCLQMYFRRNHTLQRWQSSESVLGDSAADRSIIINVKTRFFSSPFGVPEGGS